MGEVWKARDRELDHLVALKMIRPDLMEEPGLLDRFRREITLARKVTHKNVCRIYDLGEVEGTRFISMEYLEGVNLKDFIREEGPLPEEKATPIAVAIGEGLKAAHDAGVVHRDLKPQNILIDRDGVAHVMDFGIAFSGETAGLTRTGALVGTPEYMSPEQVRGERLDVRSDIYSLGLILYEMVTGDLPFTADSVASSMYKRLSEKPRKPRELRKDVPPFLEKMILRCLEKERVFRYASVDEILGDLREKQASAAPLARRWARWGWKAAGLAALAVILFAGAALLVWTGRLRLGPAAPSVPAPARSVALLPFENATDTADFDWTRTGLSALVSDGLEGVKELRILDGERIQEALENLEMGLTGRYTPFDLRRTGSVLGAEFLVSGAVRRAGNELQVEARLLRLSERDVQEVAVLRAPGQGAGSAFALAAELAEQIAKALKVPGPLPGPARRPPTTSVEALRLYSEAFELYRRGRHLDAAQRLEETVERDSDFAAAHALLSRIYGRLGERDRALAASEQAMKHLDAFPEPVARLVRARHWLLGDQLDRGIQEYRSLIEAYPQNVAARFEFAQSLERKGDLANASEELGKCIVLDPKHARAKYSLGLIRRKQGDYESALGIFSDLLATYTQAGDDEGMARTFQELGNLKMVTSQYSDALHHFRQALELMTKLGDRNGMAATLGNIAGILRVQGKYPEAIRTGRESLDLRREVGDRSGTARTWLALGEIHEDAGQIREAQNCYEESLRIVRDLEDPSLLAKNLSSLGYVSNVLGDYPQAYLLYQEALHKRREIGDRRELLKSLIEIGLIEQMQGRYKKALAYADESMKIALEIGEKAGAVIVFTNLGMVHDDQGSYAAALSSLREAVEGARAIGDRNLIASALIALGGALAHLGTLEESEQLLGEAQRVIEEMGSDALMPELQNFQAEVAAARRDTERCLRILSDAVRRAESLGDRRLVLLSRLNLGRWLLTSGRAAGRSHLTWVAEEAGKVGLAPLRVRALSYLASAGGGLPDAARGASADRAIREGKALDIREAMVLAYPVLAKRAAAKGNAAEASRFYLQAGELVRQMGDGLTEPYRSALLGRPDLAKLRESDQKRSEGFHFPVGESR